MARVAVGKAPGEIALAARTLAPPTVSDDQALYAQRALRITWTRDRRVLVFSGRLPLEQGVVFEEAIWSIAKRQRAIDKQTGSVLEWQPSTADALVALARGGTSAGADGGITRSPTTLIVHLSDDAPPRLEGAGPISRETAARLTCDARRLAIRPRGRDLVHSRVGSLRLLRPATRLAQALRALPVTGNHPAFTDQAGRAITTNQPHAPPG